MNNKGQLSVEYILFLTVILIVIIFTSITLMDEIEKNTIIYSAKIGALEGVDKNAYAMYYNDTFYDYEKNYPNLLYSNKIDIINVTIIQSDSNKLTIQIYAHSNSNLSTSQKYVIGSRINYYCRRSISKAFDKNQMDLYYNPTYSNKYVITTQDVKWI